jgi:hypothetical protein
VPRRVAMGATGSGGQWIPQHRSARRAGRSLLTMSASDSVQVRGDSDALWLARGVAVGPGLEGLREPVAADELDKPMVLRRAGSEEDAKQKGEARSCSLIPEDGNF